MRKRVMYLFACAAPPVVYVDRAVRDAQARGWEVCLGLTPTAREWLADRLEELEELTGHPVRSSYRAYGEPETWPRTDVVVVAPATLHTVNACALGITSTFVVGFTAEAMGKRIPLVMMPCLNSTYARHPQFGRSVEILRGAGAAGGVPVAPGAGRRRRGGGGVRRTGGGVRGRGPRRAGASEPGCAGAVRPARPGSRAAR
ncbi:flavoprotein [Streptomyces sp. URMC 125]|uniref:flavoprotein n=1 Tax=Streptomyces sp. URMC 125 TaxID=3423419 RepID=UPI003F199B58